MAHTGSFTGSGTIVLSGEAATSVSRKYISEGTINIYGSAQAIAISNCDPNGSRCFIINKSSNNYNKLLKQKILAMEKIAKLQAIVPADDCSYPLTPCKN